MDDLLESLIEKPHDIFKYFKPGDESASNEFNSLTKSFLDPYTKKYSVLDEIYIDGLDSTQVFGQSKMVFDAVGEYLLSTGIPEVRQKFDLGSSLEAESDDDENDGSEDLALGDEIDDEAEGFESEDDNDVHDDDVETSDKFDSENEQFDSDDEGDIGSDEATTLRENSEEDEQDSDAETHVEAEIETKKDAFGLNDEFFDIDEYNRQVVELENDENNNDDEQIDFFADLSDEDSEEEDMAYYDEFFDKPGSHLKETSNTKKPVKIQSDNIDEEEDLNEKDYDNAVDNAMLDLFADEEEDDDDNNSQPKEENLSSFEKQQQKLQKEIEKLEAELVADKKWTMKGEISSKDRPQDSLLDDPESANLEFDRTAKPVPIITEDVTETIEDLIRRRIKNNEFDDLPKRFITDVSKFHNRQKYELSEQKSTKSLAEIYEDQYNQVDENKEITDELKKKHDEISELFNQVSHKLDALCSAHFIPKPHQFKTIEIKVNDNAASINMEDSQPLHVSSESTLAPQEIYKIGDDKPKANGVLGRSEVQLKSGLSYSKDELSRDEKQRLRRANKRKRSKEFNQKQSIQKQKEVHQQKTQPNANKRQKVGQVIDTLSKAKNITVIDKKGQLRDVKGNLKKDNAPKGSNNLKL